MSEFGNQSKSYLSELVKLAKNSFKAFSYQNLSISSAAVFALTVPDGTKYAELVLESSVTATVPIRYKIDGGVPTTTDGMPLNHLDRFDITDAANVNNFKVIRTGAGTYNLHITYYR